MKESPVSNDPRPGAADNPTASTSSAQRYAGGQPFLRTRPVVILAVVALLLGAIILSQSRLDPVASTSGLTGDAGSLDHADHFWGPFPEVIPTISLTPSSPTTIRSISVADVQNGEASNAAAGDPGPAATSTVSRTPADR